jgi:hypothetical protein
LISLQELLSALRASSAGDNVADHALIAAAVHEAATRPVPLEKLTCLQAIVLTVSELRLVPASLEELVRGVAALSDETVEGIGKAQLLSFLGMRMATSGPNPPADEVLAGAGQQLLERGLREPDRIGLAVATADAWLRLGRTDRALVLLRRTYRGLASAEGRSHIALRRANLLWDYGDIAGACRAIERAFSESLPEALKAELALAILTLCPIDYPRFETWLDRARSAVRYLDEFGRAAKQLNMVVVLARFGRLESARALFHSIPLGDLANTLSPGLREPFDVSVAFARTMIDTSPDVVRDPMTGHSVANDGVVALTLTGRYADAAAVALSEAERLRGLGWRLRELDNLGHAAKLLGFAGEHRRCLEIFGRLFRMLEHDVEYESDASMLIHRLVGWAELYAQAAVAALRAGESLRAVELAEVGRARAIGHRLGPGHRSRPPGVEREPWERFVRSWRMAVARAANNLVDQVAVTEEEAADLDDELDEARDAVLAAGVQVGVLSPVERPRPIQETLASLRQAGRPIAILYTIRLDAPERDIELPDTKTAGRPRSGLRLVVISQDGAEEAPLPESAQQLVLERCDAYVKRLREIAPATLEAEIRQQAPRLIADVSPALSPALEFAASRARGGRLVWIPQGSLVSLPIGACAAGPSPLLERAALLVAPSLAMAKAALARDAAVPLQARVVEGRSAPGEPTVDGAATLLPGGASFESPSRAESAFELGRAFVDRPLALLACHGVYDWQDPLGSYLKLDRDVSVESLLEDLMLDSRTLVLLAACDSGTVAQQAINEAVGIPTAMLTAGAHAVVGATWPVAKVAALGICCYFLHGLAAGLASPEALQRACLRLRNTTLDGLAGDLEQVGHPYAADLRAKVARRGAALGQEPFFRDKPFTWASFVHWGGGWRSESA